MALLIGKKVQTVHFIGIGGIGMSALARWFLHLGWNVSGSDSANSPLLRQLKKEGMKIMRGHRAKNLSSRVGLVIYSQAIITRGKHINAEIREAKKRGLHIQSYPEALGEFTHGKFTIAICGMHGKSTTTALTGVLLRNAAFDPTVVIGATVPEFDDKNFLFGKSDFLVIEADEYKGAFLHYNPDIIIWTNVDREHLDYFKNFRNITMHFRKFIARLPKEGWLIANGDDPIMRDIVMRSRGVKNKIFYTLKNPYASGVKKNLHLIGEHNVSNALAVFELSKILGIPQIVFLKTLRNFTGIGRRMEYKGEINGTLFFEDYAHHPTEIKATLAGVRDKYKNRLREGKLWCVFQPHQYQRTSFLLHEFSDAFGDADAVVLVDIYTVTGREKKSVMRAVNSQKLCNLIIKKRKSAFYMPAIKDAARFLKKVVGKNDVVIAMGAGDIWKIWNSIF